MDLNVLNCVVLSYIRDTGVHLRAHYFLNGSFFRRVDKFRDLGSIMTPLLGLQGHILHITARINSGLGFIFKELIKASHFIRL